MWNILKSSTAPLLLTERIVKVLLDRSFLYILTELKTVYKGLLMLYISWHVTINCGFELIDIHCVLKAITFYTLAVISYGIKLIYYKCLLMLLCNKHFRPVTSPFENVCPNTKKCQDIEQAMECSKCHNVNAQNVCSISWYWTNRVYISFGQVGLILMTKSGPTRSVLVNLIWFRKASFAWTIQNQQKCGLKIVRYMQGLYVWPHILNLAFSVNVVG